MIDNLLSQLLCHLGTAVFERRPNGRFTLLVEPPPWYCLFFDLTDNVEVNPGSVFPFVDYFLLEAETAWAGGWNSSLPSGVWSQPDANSVERSFQAWALTLSGRVVLTINELGLDREDQRQLLAKARQNRLDFERDTAVRKRQEQTLLITRDRLEKCVSERTDELARTNKELRIEVDHRRRAETHLLRQQKQLRRLASRLSLAEERERRRIAAGLHNEVGHYLAMVKIKLASHKDTASPTGESHLSDELVPLIDQALQATRSLTFELSPPSLYELGLEAALEGLVEQVRARYGFECVFLDDHRPKPLDEDVKVVLFQAARELMLNVAKHAGARCVEMATKKTTGGIRLVVADDGVGFDTGQSGIRFDRSGGFGLFNLRERLDDIGGDLKIQSSAISGTRVTIEAPLAEGEPIGATHG